MFREHAGTDPVENLKFMADQGFRAFFDNGLLRREPAEVDKIVAAAQRLGLATGPFVTGRGQHDGRGRRRGFPRSGPPRR